MDLRNFTKTNISLKLLEKTEKAVLKAVGIKKSRAEISLVVVGEKRMARFNYVWRGKKGPTDVLSFGFWEVESGNLSDSKKGKKHIGEIIICAAIAKKRAKVLSCGFNEEFTRLLVHGMLHLAGYEHEKTEKEAKKMELMEERLLKKF